MGGQLNQPGPRLSADSDERAPDEAPNGVGSSPSKAPEPQPTATSLSHGRPNAWSPPLALPVASRGQPSPERAAWRSRLVAGGCRQRRWRRLHQAELDVMRTVAKLVAARNTFHGPDRLAVVEGTLLGRRR